MRRLLLPLLGAAAAAVALSLVLAHDDRPRPATPEWPHPPHLVPRPGDGQQPLAPMASPTDPGPMQLLPRAEGSAPVYPL